MKYWRHEAKWTGISILVMLLWMVGERATGLHSHNIHLQMYITMLYLIPAEVVFVMALRSIKKHKYNGQMTYAMGLRSGLMITALLTLTSPATQWIISYVITPDYFENVIAYAVEVSYFPDRATAVAHFNFQNYAIQSTVSSAVIGVISFLILPLFVRSKTIQ
jgi:hypothetical protein